MRSYLILFFWLIPWSFAQAKVVVSADMWFPMNGIPRSESPGFMIEIAERALALHQMKLEYKILPWQRAIEQVRAGHINCIVGASKRPGHDFIFGQQAYGIDESALYVLHNDPWRYSNPAQLATRQVGYIADYSYGVFIDAQLKVVGIALHGNNALTRNIKKLLSGRLDTLIESKTVMANKLATMQLTSTIIHAGSLGYVNQLFIACSPNNAVRSQHIVDALDNGIIRLRKAGIVDTIMRKYGLTDWQ